MAKVVGEKNVVEFAGPSGARVRVSGFTKLSGGDNNFVIAPGLNTTNITSPIPSIGLKTIDCWQVMCVSAQEAGALRIQKLTDTATSSDYLSVQAAAADESYIWWVEGPYLGD